MDKPITNKHPRFRCNFCLRKKTRISWTKKPLLHTCFPEKYRKNHGTNKPSSLTAMIFRQKMANTSPAMLRFTAVMPAGKLVTEISWALIRCDLGSVSRIFYTSFMLPENRMYFLQVGHNIIYIYFFLRAEVWVASRILILPYLFFPLLNVLTAQTYQSQMWISQDTFSTISPKEVQLFRFLDGQKNYL